jgi:two-component system response regulator DevR
MIRLLLVNQMRLLCNVLASVLEDEPDMQVVGCATSLGEALDLAAKSDVILVNTRMPDDAALQLTRTIVKTELPVKVLALGLAESEEQILQYVQAGATGYVLKDDSVADMLEQIRAVYAGRVRVSPRIASALMSRVNEYAQLFDKMEISISNPADFTPREREILELIGQAHTNQQIAEQLVIAEGTVKNYVHSILQKLDATNRHQAATIWTFVKERERAG